MVICLSNAPACFLVISTKSLQNCENYGLFSLTQNPIYADRNGEFVYHDFKIIYKRFESAGTKADHERSWRMYMLDKNLVRPRFSITK